MAVSKDVMTTSKDDVKNPCTGPASDVLPEAIPQFSGNCSHTGVSTFSALMPSADAKRKAHWYALRTTYGREKKAYDFMTSHGIVAFMPTIMREKEVGGKKKMVETSRIPNIFFAYGTEDVIKSFVYDNYNLPFLRFYYKHTHVGARIEKTPLIVPDAQIRTLQIISGQSPYANVLVIPDEIKKFMTGERVRVVEGMFKGVEGIVARFQGQQRVGIVIDGLFTAMTAYVPTAFLEPT